MALCSCFGARRAKRRPPTAQPSAPGHDQRDADGTTPNEAPAVAHAAAAEVAGTPHKPSRPQHLASGGLVQSVFVAAETVRGRKAGDTSLGTASPSAVPRLDIVAYARSEHSSIPPPFASNNTSGGCGIPAHLQTLLQQQERILPASLLSPGATSTALNSRPSSGLSPPTPPCGVPADLLRMLSTAAGPTSNPSPPRSARVPLLVVSTGGAGGGAASTTTTTHSRTVEENCLLPSGGAAVSGSGVITSGASALSASEAYETLATPSRQATFAEPPEVLAAQQCVGVIRPSSLGELRQQLEGLRFLAAGSSGRVYQGLWCKSPVAVKIVLSREQGAAQESSREALLSRCVSHPSICQCFTIATGVVTEEDLLPPDTPKHHQHHQQHQHHQHHQHHQQQALTQQQAARSSSYVGGATGPPCGLPDAGGSAANSRRGRSDNLHALQALTSPAASPRMGQGQPYLSFLDDARPMDAEEGAGGAGTGGSGSGSRESRVAGGGEQAHSTEPPVARVPSALRSLVRSITAPDPALAAPGCARAAGDTAAAPSPAGSPAADAFALGAPHTLAPSEDSPPSFGVSAACPRASLPSLTTPMCRVAAAVAAAAAASSTAEPASQHAGGLGSPATGSSLVLGLAADAHSTQPMGCFTPTLSPASLVAMRSVRAAAFDETLSLTEILGSGNQQLDVEEGGQSLPSVLTSINATPGCFVTVVVSELCNQGTLMSRVRSHPFNSERTPQNTAGLLALLRTALEVAQGMRYLHDMDIVHGDLKPSNVLLQTAGPSMCDGAWPDTRGYVAKTTDFGLATPALSSGGGSALNLASAVHWGALSYLAPEVPCSGPSKQSDVYSYGCLLYTLCTGKQPFQGIRAARLMASLASGALRVEFSDTVYQPLRRLAQLCCSPSPTERPQFECIVKALQRIIHHVASCSPRARSMETGEPSLARAPPIAAAAPAKALDMAAAWRSAMAAGLQLPLAAPPPPPPPPPRPSAEQARPSGGESVPLQ